MVFVDASALTAMLTEEDDARALLTRLQAFPERFTSPLAIWEAAIALSRILGLDLAAARTTLDAFLVLTEIEVRAVPAGAHEIALDAFARYGKGRHPAGLNFGDCFAYAAAKGAGVPMLYKGDDFPQTDIPAA
jgi:ribonuclease VapC